MAKGILITGATGFLGRNLVPLLLEDPETEIYMLSRSPECPPAFLQYKDDGRMHFLQGDLERPTIFQHQDREKLKQELKQIIHLAGLTVFLEEDRSTLTKLNIGGTQNVINFSRECRNLENLVYMSTAYTMNREHSDLIMEDEPQTVTNFGNPYEETKFAAECLIRDSKLLFSILRPAVFAGDSITGATGYDSRSGHGVIYGLFRAAATHEAIGGVSNFFQWRENQKDTLPEKYLDVNCNLAGHNEVLKNFMFIDDIAGQTAAILKARPIGEGKTFHIVGKTPITTKEMLDAMQFALRVRGFRFAGNPRAGDWTPDRGNKVERIADRIITRHYAPYFLRQEPHFDTSNTDAALAETGYKRLHLTRDKFAWLTLKYIENDLPVVAGLAKPAEQMPAKISSASSSRASSATGETIPYFNPEFFGYIKRFGEGSLDYSILQPGMKYHHIPGTGVVAFMEAPSMQQGSQRAHELRARMKERIERETGIDISLEDKSTLHVLSDPVCNPTGLEALLESFLAHHPNACFWQTSHTFSELLRKHGYKVNEFGTDTLLDLGTYNFSGAIKQNIRTARNQAKTRGYAIVEENPEKFDWQQAREISNAWIGMKHERNIKSAGDELIFLARPMEYHPEEGVRIFSAREGPILKGFGVYSPMYNDGRVIGYLADIMRHCPDQGYGLCDAINYEAILKFQSEKIRLLSLGLSPFSRIEEGDKADPIIHEIFKQAFKDEEANAVYDFQGNAFHKSRYGGRIVPVYFCTKEDIPLEQTIGLFRACKAF